VQTAADTGTLGSQGSRVEKKKITHGRKPSTVLAELDKTKFRAAEQEEAARRAMEQIVMQK